MNPGHLDQRGTLQRRSVAAAGALGDPPPWENVQVGCYARIRALSAHELIAARAVQSSVSHEITIRWRPDVTAAMRFKQGNRIFDLGPPINPGERNEWLVIQAIEGLSGG